MSTMQFAMTPESKNYLEPSLQSVLYSSYAYLHPQKPLWRVQVQGQVYSDRPLPFSKRFMLRGLERALHLDAEQARGSIFQARVNGFLTTPEAGQRIRVQHNSTVYRLRQRSRRSGLFQGRFDLPTTTVGRNILNEKGTSILTLKTGSELGEASGSAFLAGHSGISIITDIDDTIKQTDVTSRSRMLARTFVEEFEAIEGMAHVYRQWAEQGGLFHYVSSSPWQIYEPLQAFLNEHHFPEGSMHLKWFRLRDEIFKRWTIIRRKSKAGVIASMIKRMAYRKFLLVGDSGERDPEIYAKLARKFPEQIRAVLIRDLDAHRIDRKRYDSLVKRMRHVPFIVFRDPDEINPTLSYY